MRLVVDVAGRELEVDADLTESVEVLRNQVFSLLDVSVEDLDVILDGFGPLSDDIDLSRISFPTNRLLLRHRIDQLPSDWTECCTGLFLSSPALQPASQVLNLHVCQGCAGLCRAGSPAELDIHKEPFRCQCIGTEECLFACRKEEWYPLEAQKQVSTQLTKACQTLWKSYFGAGIDEFSIGMRRNREVLRLYEDPGLQEAARKLIPKETLEARQAALSTALPGRDGYLEQLLTWFKSEFFTWTNAPKCQQCGAATENTGSAQPTAEELRYTARRVETYSCPQGHITRFPRYNHPGKLLETRTGRCGEWANCFGLILRASGYETRVVLDYTDHVWNEAWSELQKRWLHCDSCEAKLDSPLLYEQGWGKKLTYVFAESIYGVKDVILRYTKDFAEVKKRRGQVPEPWIALYTKDVSQRLRSSLQPADFKRMQERDESEDLELQQGRVVSTGEVQPRESGDLAWRQARGELGSACAPTEEQKVPREEAKSQVTPDKPTPATPFPDSKPTEEAKVSPSPPLPDPKTSKSDIKQKVARAFLQLTAGCSKADCSNEHCASSGKGRKMGASEAAALALKLVASGQFRLCG